MTCGRRRYGCLLLFLFALPPLYAAAGNGYDVVTLNNGDIYNGTVAQAHFTLVTRYGEVPVPYAQMALLIMGGGEQPDRILTRRGDRFSGRLKERELTMLRVLDPTLPVAVEDVAEILFADRKLRPRLFKTPDAVITQDGDHFAARVISEALPMTGHAGARLTNPSGIHLLDVISLDEGEDYLAQITANDGQVIQGKFALEQVAVTTGFGAALNIPFAQLSQLALRVNHSGKPPAFRFLQRLNPVDLLQDRMRDGSLGPQLLALRGGTYTRGDLQGDGDADERPPQQVQLQPFAIGVHEVTFDEYDRFCADTGHRKPDDQGWGRGSRPVVNVSWEDANAYAAWLSRRTEQRYRLPSDAEWEYAARAGSGSRFWWGDDPQPHRANCADCGSLWDGEKSAPVGRFPPNPFGLHDTAGNVFEWVADCWQESFVAVSSAAGEGACGKRVIRGGAWSFPAREIRSANRWRDFPTRRSDDTGFRLVRELVTD
ncbi:SUMF1/EgtB/PvdO family nonheme iron enzyme [Sedimenticola hydrogenitrophicus]|uniref:SUMF1/EgtB/PvdO family nonheme iron enzyme n=1 Tax=Sedimenticola hydrogenitrophicus TaxID=2967975 RepID=UPI0023B1D623|nr:SUMF1/EgtB/PvdO family nonheme iron enzyme [Sedimenticola hydrogenitrophicus]